MIEDERSDDENPPLPWPKNDRATPSLSSSGRTNPA